MYVHDVYVYVFFSEEEVRREGGARGKGSWRSQRGSARTRKSARETKRKRERGLGLVVVGGGVKVPGLPCCVPLFPHPWKN